MINLTPSTEKNQEDIFSVSLDRFACAFRWLKLGVPVLPLQPGSKKLMPGFGEHGRQVKTRKDAEYWWGPGRDFNLAVLAPDWLLALDFDDDALFWRWSDAVSLAYAETYQETSRRGWHVFYRLADPVPAGVSLLPGVELKRVLMVAPSTLPDPGTVAGYRYQPVDPGAPVVTVSDWRAVLLPLLSDSLPQPKPAKVRKVADPGTGNRVAMLKRVVSILELAGRMTDLRSSDDGKGRWYVGRCPFHEDQHPSLWIDAKRGLWGCRAGCGKGDVINLYARWKGISVTRAIKEMAAEFLVLNVPK